MSIMVLPSYVGAKEWDCEITIDANKHVYPNYAYPTDGCNSSKFAGYWAGDMAGLTGSYTGEVSNGEIVYLGANEYVKVTVIPPKKPDPKPEPEEPKDPKPEKPKDPKPEKPKEDRKSTRLNSSHVAIS